MLHSNLNEHDAHVLASVNVLGTHSRVHALTLVFLCVRPTVSSRLGSAPSCTHTVVLNFTMPLEIVGHLGAECGAKDGQPRRHWPLEPGECFQCCIDRAIRIFAPQVRHDKSPPKRCARSVCRGQVKYHRHASGAWRIISDTHSKRIRFGRAHRMLENRSVKNQKCKLNTCWLAWR